MKWANMNMGAKSSIENGLYFAWNEVKVDDEGRLPSEAEMMELIEKCNWEWVSKDGVNGYLVTSKDKENKNTRPQKLSHLSERQHPHNKDINHLKGGKVFAINFYR